MKNNEFGNILKNLRIERGISQRKLGQAFGVANQTISTWETGVREPDLDTLVKLAQYFNVSVGFLLGVEEI